MDIGNLSAVGVNGGVADLIESEGIGGSDDREEAGVGVGDQLRFEGYGFGPGMEAIFFNLDSVTAGIQIKFVIGNGG